MSLYFNLFTIIFAICLIGQGSAIMSFDDYIRSVWYRQMQLRQEILRHKVKRDIAVSDKIFDMSRQIATKLSKENSKFIAFSPLSIATTLAQLQMGATGNAEQELIALMGIANHEQFGNIIEQIQGSKQSQQINLANGIFIDKNNGITLRENYRASVETIYQSQIVALDFANERTASRKYINDWIKSKTNGKIEKILTGGFGNNHYNDDDGIMASGDEHKSNGMLIANALYFKAFWQKAFINGVTTKRMFYPNGKRDGAKGKFLVDMMATAGQFRFYNSKEYECRILALPYQNGESNMYVVLPYASNRAKLSKVQESLTPEKMEEIIGKMKSQNVIVNFPKLHLEQSFSIKSVLEDMNVKSIFNSKEGNFDKMICNTRSAKNRRQLENGGFFVDDFMHKTNLMVNEAGTEGAAATLSFLSRQDETDVEFRVDTPFMFFIRHESTKIPIFYGSVYEPVNF
ncbi:hypothetical protein ACFFRR_004956 [Megaselia abdita]